MRLPGPHANLDPDGSIRMYFTTDPNCGKMPVISDWTHIDLGASLPEGQLFDFRIDENGGYEIRTITYKERQNHDIQGSPQEEPQADQGAQPGDDTP